MVVFTEILNRIGKAIDALKGKDNNNQQKGVGFERYVISKQWTMYMLWVYLFSFSLLGLLTWLLSISPSLGQMDFLNQHLLVQAFSYSFAAGGIGASMYSIRMLHYQSHLKDNREDGFRWGWGWVRFYFNRPMLGAFLGFIIYVLIQGGLFTLPDKNQATSKFLLAIGLGWLVGYNVTEIILRLEKTATALFGLEKEKTPFDKLKDLINKIEDEELNQAANSKQEQTAKPKQDSNEETQQAAKPKQNKVM